jgi:diadenosine tetraphosphate (Ap4A) HIT family hydrolase
MTTAACPFCSLDPDRFLAETALTFTIPDRYPASRGHVLVVVKRHVASVFDVTADEWLAVKVALDRAKAEIDAEHHPAGYNVGINVGEAAGQTVSHVHVHLIPRYLGDHPQPRGGVRHVIPGKGNYP